MQGRRAFLVRPGKFEISDVNINISPDQVLVKVAACGLCNWELNHWKGLLGECPQSLGHEWSGTIVDIGRDVEGLSVGDVVTGLPDELSGFSDYSVLSAGKCFKINSDINPVYALGEPLKCVITTLRGAAPEAGDVGIVLGCGPMGLWCIQALAGKLLSALIAIDVDDEKLQLAASFGATDVINPKNVDCEGRIKEISKGHMGDFVIEGTGNTGILNTAATYLRSGRGRLILMSSHETAASDFDFRAVISRGVEIKATHPQYSLNEVEDLRRAVTYLNNGTFKMNEIINHTFKLENIQQAFETLENKPKGYMKGIVLP